jgi:hypothetical protein
VKIWPWLVGGGLLGTFALASSSASASDTGGKPPSSSTPPAKASAVMEVWAELGYPLVWQQWGAWVALGESGWKIGAQNNTPGERWASTKAYQRLTNEGRMPCAVPPLGPDPSEPGRLIVGKGYGSGSWYGQLAPLTSVFLFEKLDAPPLTCQPAQVWLDKKLSTRAHIVQARGTYKIAAAKLGGSPTPLQLRALYGLPSRDPREVDTAKRRAQYTASTTKAGLPPSWLDEPLPPLQALEGSAIDDGVSEAPDLFSPAILEALAAQTLEAA